MQRICKGCKKKIAEEHYGLVKGKMYHLSEFKCNSCLKSLDGMEVFDEDETGLLYCDECHELKFSKKCETCGGVVIGTVFEALDKYYHPYHFNCFKCKKSLTDGGYFKNEGHPVCEACFQVRKRGRLRD